MTFQIQYRSFKHKLRRIPLWLLFLFFVNHLFAQNEDFIFKNYTERDGLCDNIIFSLLKDKNNILWVGTQNGLSRFDGQNFHNFKQKRNSNSIPNNTINSLCEDLQGNVWGGTENGLFCFDPQTKKFTTYHVPKTCYNNLVNNVVCDRLGNIYATTYLELLYFNPSQKRLEVIGDFLNNHPNPDACNTSKNCLVKDEKSNALWITTSAGLYYYDLKEKKLHGFNDQKTKPIFSNRICRALTHFKDGQLMFADNTNKEIVIFDPIQKEIKEKIALAPFEPKAYVATILLDNQDKLWLSSFNHTLISIDLKRNHHFDRIIHKKDRNYTISSEFFWGALTDQNGSVWLGTLNGISVCSPKIPVFKALLLPERIADLKTTIQLVKEDPGTQDLWMTTLDQNIIHYNVKSQNYAVYNIRDFVPNLYNQVPNSIQSICFLGSRTIVTSYAGAWEYVASRKKWMPLRLLPEKFKSFLIKNILSVDTLLYLSDGADILRYNPIYQQCIKIYSRSKDGPKDDPSLEIIDLYTDSKKNLYWVGFRNYMGMYRNGQVRLIRLTGKEVSKNVGYFSASTMDNEDRLWIGFKGVGLYCFNTRNEKVKSWTEFDGWSNNHVHKILSDHKGNIWTMYFNKVSYFNPTTESFINFSIPYAENNLSYPNSMMLSKNGRAMGVVGNDVFELHAEHLSQSPSLLAPGINTITIDGKNHFVSENDSLLLKSDENSLVIRFGLLVDPIAFPHHFEYRLNGLESRWQNAVSMNVASYNHLPPGNYIFEVVAKGRNNNWQSKITKIFIHISTPFYKTYLFIGSVIMAIALLLVLLYRYRIAQFNKVANLESKAQMLEKEKAQVMYDGLKQQLNPHFLFNSLTSLSALIENDQEMASQFLSQMSDMYRYILKNANEETVLLKDELSFVETYFGLQKTRFGRGLLVNVNVPESFMLHKIAPVTLQNMMENAIKHNVIDVDSPLVIDIYTEDDYIVVKNNIQAKNNVETSNKRGLNQFLSLYRYLSSKPVVFDQTDAHFIIKIPLI